MCQRPVPAAPRRASLRVVSRRQLSRILSSAALRTRRCGLLASGAPSPALNADTFSCSTHRTPPWRVWSLVSSRALDEKVWCPRTEAVPHAKISEASFPHTLLQCVRQHASEIFPCLRVRHDRLAAAERHCAVRMIHVPRIRAGLLRLKPLQVVAEACGNIVLHRAMSWSDAETKVGHLSPWETCKAFAFYTALQAISKQLGQPPYALAGQRAPAWISESTSQVLLASEGQGPLQCVCNGQEQKVMAV